MSLLTLRPHEVRFPDRCVRCSGAAGEVLELETIRGIDLLVVAHRRTLEVEAPMCARCLGRHRLRRALWHVAMLVTLLLMILLPMAISAALSATASPSPLLMPLVLPATLGWIWFWRNREQDLFHRCFSPLAIRRWSPESGEIDLSFKQAELWQEVGVLSGVLDRAALGRATSGRGYRDAALAPLPMEWRRPRERSASSWWVPGAFGLLCFLASGYIWWEAVRAEELGRSFRSHILVVLLYDLGGVLAAVAPFVVIGIGAVALSVGMLVRGIGVGRG